MAKAKKSKGAKTKKVKKSARRAAASTARGRTKKTKTKAKKAAKASKPAKAKRAAKKAAPPKKKQVMGEGDYQASRSFLKDQGEFVKRHSAEIPKMGKEAEAALEGPEGDTLRQAEGEARSHAHE